MKRRTTQNLKHYLFTSVFLFSILAGFIISPNNNLTSPPTGHSGEDSNKPLAHAAPSLSTAGYVFYDDFIGSPMGSLWINNTKAISRGATFSTTTKDSYLTIYTPASDTYIFQQSTSPNDYGAYSNTTLSSKLATLSSTFTIETKVDYSKSGASNNFHLGLMIRFANAYQVYIYGPVGSSSTPGRTLRITYAGSTQNTQTPFPSAPSEYYLRITKNGTTFSFFYSTDGVNWNLQYSQTRSQIPKGVGVIVRTWGTLPPPAVTANFDYFRISVEAAVDQAIPSSTALRSGQTVTIQAHMRYYNMTMISLGYMGLLVNGTLDQIQSTNSTGWATFSKIFYTAGTREFTLYAINNSYYNLKPVTNETREATWTAYTITVGVTNYDGEPVIGATTRLQFAANNSNAMTPETTNETGYCKFVGVLYAVANDYKLNITQQLYNSTSTAYYSKIVYLDQVDHDFTQGVTLDTTKLLVYVTDLSSPPIPFQGAVVKLLNGTEDPWLLLATSQVNLTAWATLVVPINAKFNVTVWYGGTKQTIVWVNQTNVNKNWYPITSTHKWYLEMNATGTPKIPTTLKWRIQPDTAYWDQSFLLSVWFNVTATQVPYDPDWISCTVGSYSGPLVKNLTGNWYVVIPAHLIGGIPSGSTNKSFTLRVDAGFNGGAYQDPAPLLTTITMQALPLNINHSDSFAVYYNSSAILWAKLSFLNGTGFNGGAFSLTLDGNPTSYRFSSIGNGNYTLVDATTFGLSVGSHLFSVTLTGDNYTSVGLPTFSITLTVQALQTNPADAHYSLYDESLQSRSGETVYWNWAFEFSVNYTLSNGQPVSGAFVLISFFSRGSLVLEATAVYNSTIKAYGVEFDSTSFPTAGSYDYSITISRTGYISRTFFSHVDISWRPLSITPTSLTYDSIKGAFGGDSSAQVEITLCDTLTGLPLIGANVSYTWDYGSGNFTEAEAGNGIYTANVYAGAEVPVAGANYRLVISVAKEYYLGNATYVNLNVDFAGGHVVLPIFGVVPLSMFAIVLGAVAVASGVGGLRAYVWATTPYIVKQINKILHAVEKGMQAEPIAELRTRVQTPMSLLLTELESAGISLEKVAAPAVEVVEEVEPEEVEPEVETEPEKPKRKVEKAEVKPEEPEIKAKEEEVPEKSAEDAEQAVSNDQQADTEEKPDEGGN